MSRLPNPDLPFVQQDRVILLAMCLWGEARGLSALGVAGVACTILNRMRAKAADVAQVVLAKKQFSSFNADDPNSAKLVRPLTHDSAAAWEKCLTVAELALNGALHDITGGASHYYADSMTKPPYWADPAKGWKQTAKLVGHTFGVAA